MVSSAELQLLNDNSQHENDKDASGGDSPKVRAGCRSTQSVRGRLDLQFMTLLHISSLIWPQSAMLTRVTVTV